MPPIGKVGLGDGVADLPDYVARNDLGTAVLLSAMAAADVGRLVLASSMVVYGEGAYRCAEHGAVRPGPRTRADLDAGRFEPRCPRCGEELSPEVVDEDGPLDPRNGYAATKVAQEHLASAWARVTGGEAVALRYHNVYGPRLPRDTPYDFVHVRDVAHANVLALGAPGAPAGEPLTAYNIASGLPGPDVEREMRTHLDECVDCLVFLGHTTTTISLLHRLGPQGGGS